MEQNLEQIGHEYAIMAPYSYSPTAYVGVVGWCDGAGLTSRAGASY